MEKAFWCCFGTLQTLEIHFLSYKKNRTVFFYFGVHFMQVWNLQSPQWGNLTAPVCAVHCRCCEKLKSISPSKLSNCAVLNEHNAVLCCSGRWGCLLTKLFFVWFLAFFFLSPRLASFKHITGVYWTFYWGNTWLHRNQSSWNCSGLVCWQKGFLWKYSSLYI